MKADYPSINDELHEVDWDTVYVMNQLTSTGTFSKTILFNLFPLSILRKLQRNPTLIAKPSWWTTQISKAVKTEKHHSTSLHVQMLIMLPMPLKEIKSNP